MSAIEHRPWKRYVLLEIDFDWLVSIKTVVSFKLTDSYVGDG